MISRQRNKSKYKVTKFVVGIFVLLLLFRIFNITFLSKIFDHPVNFILESNTIVLSPLKNTLVYFKDKKDLEAQVKQLQSDNTNLTLENLLNRNISQEFEYFAAQFGTTSLENTFFKVILRPPFTPFDSIRISGNLEGYQVDDLVFYKSILIGKIIEKSNRYATVELFSSPEKVTPIVVKGTQFEAKGLGGGRFVFETAKDFDIAQGDPIIYPEQKILVLGVVEFIETKEEDLFKKIYFNLPTPLNTISYVNVGI